MLFLKTDEYLFIIHDHNETSIMTVISQRVAQPKKVIHNTWRLLHPHKKTVHTQDHHQRINKKVTHLKYMVTYLMSPLLVAKRKLSEH